MKRGSRFLIKTNFTSAKLVQLISQFRLEIIITEVAAGSNTTTRQRCRCLNKAARGIFFFASVIRSRNVIDNRPPKKKKREGKPLVVVILKIRSQSIYGLDSNQPATLYTVPSIQIEHPNQTSEITYWSRISD